MRHARHAILAHPLPDLHHGGPARILYFAHRRERADVQGGLRDEAVVGGQAQEPRQEDRDPEHAKVPVVARRLAKVVLGLLRQHGRYVVVKEKEGGQDEGRQQRRNDTGGGHLPERHEPRARRGRLERCWDDEPLHPDLGQLGQKLHSRKEDNSARGGIVGNNATRCLV